MSKTKQVHVLYNENILIDIRKNTGIFWRTCKKTQTCPTLAKDFVMTLVKFLEVIRGLHKMLTKCEKI